MMFEPEEFPSPFNPPVTPAVTPPAPAVAPFQPETPIDAVITAIASDPEFFRFITELALLPPDERAAELRSIGFWRDYLKGVERAKVIKAHQPELVDREVADLARVRRETVGRDAGYLDLKKLMSSGPAKADKWRGRHPRRIEDYGQEDDDVRGG